MDLWTFVLCVLLSMFLDSHNAKSNLLSLCSQQFEGRKCLLNILLLVLDLRQLNQRNFWVEFSEPDMIININNAKKVFGYFWNDFLYL